MNYSIIRCLNYIDLVIFFVHLDCHFLSLSLSLRCALASFFFFWCCLLYSLSLYSVLFFLRVYLSCVCVCFLNKQRPLFGLLNSFYLENLTIGDMMIYLAYMLIMECNVIIRFLFFSCLSFCGFFLPHRTLNQSTLGLDEDKIREGKK